VTAFKQFASLDKQHPELRQIAILAGIFFSLALLFGMHRYYTLYASYDQGIFNQVFWNGSHGRFFQSSLSSVLSTNVVHDNQPPEVFYHRLGQHFTPALLLWLPIYALFPSAATLVVIQVSLITAGGVVLYALARHYLQPPLAWLIAAGYYGANAVIGPVFSNFHDLTQIPLFVFGLLLAMEKRIWWLFWLLAVCTLMVRQDTGVILFGVGVYLAMSRRHPKIGIALCALSFSYILLATNAFMPLFSQDISRRFMIERFGQYAESDKATTLQILWAIVSNPGRLLYQLFIRSGDQKIFYLLAQGLPLMLIPLIARPAWMIAGFPLLQLFLQQGESPLSIHIRYAITVVPGFFYGAILWWSQHSDRFTPRLRNFWKGCIVLSVLIACLYSPHRVFYFALPDSYRPWVHVPLTRQWHHVGQARSLMQQIPPDASVSATTYLIPPISGRREILRMPFLQVRNDARQVVDVDYILADLWQLQTYQVAFKAERQTLQQVVPMIDKLLSDRKYGIVGLADGVILLKRDTPSNAQALATWQALRPTIQFLPIKS
jgi:uncharacterized membrane protein